MKTSLRWLLIPAVALGLGSCKKETPPAEAASPAAAPSDAVPSAPATKPVVPGAPAAAAASPVPAASADQRAEKLGFAKHLPGNVETLITVFNGSKTKDRAKTLKLWKLIEDLGGIEAGVEPEKPDVADADKIADPAAGPAETTQPTDPAEGAVIGAAAGGIVEPGEPAVAEEKPFDPEDLVGTEVTIALGDTSGEQIGHLLHLNSRSSYFSIRGLTKMLLAKAKNPEAETEEPFGEQMIFDLVNDPESGLGLVEKLTFPPVYIAAKVDAAKREEAGRQLSAGLGMVSGMGEFVEPLEFEKAGFKFTGHKIVGAKLSEELAKGRKDLEEEMKGKIEPETIDRAFAAIAKRDLVLVSGTVGDYIVLFIGGSQDQLQLAASVKESLVAGGALAFADPYLAKDLSALVYGDKASQESLIENTTRIADLTNGIRDGISGQDGLGDTREIESLLKVVAEREAVLYKFAKTTDSGTVAFFEDGYKIESIGGMDQGSLDWNTPSKFGHLGDGPETVLFADMTMDAAYDKAATEFIESLFETGYAITKKVAELPGDVEDLKQFKEMTTLFDGKFRTDAVGLWEALSGDFADGLGHESALVLDLKGTVPTLPGLPQAVVDQGKFPRLSVISPVVDRAKLAASWDKMNKSTTGILAKVSEMVKEDIPMQKPISSEKNGMTTWFFPMPFFNDDFMPSVTVGDKWFVASTSKNQALDLAALADKGIQGKKGLVMKVNFVALQSYLKEMSKVIDANAPALFGENGIGEYNDNKENINKGIEAFDDFDSLMVHCHKEGEVLRSSVHFKTR